MRHTTWTAIEGNSVTMDLYRAYRRLPGYVRTPARWIVAPRWHAVCAYVVARSKGRVVAGPFEGLKLQLSSVSSRHLLGYILGTQELELHGVVEEIVARDYSHIINVGVADGYYAVGFARRMPSTRVIGFEGLPEHHPLVRRAAEENGVSDRIELRGFCESSDLDQALIEAGPKSLVVCDIEGGEKALLDPEKSPELANADILVETHDGLLLGCTRTMVERFEATHDIVSILARPRTMVDFPFDKLPLLPTLVPETAIELMNERRTGLQEWLFMTAR
ncbi:hypothetical protein [Fulvimarina sp. MAC3]|uniref:hypothetical protein n=1 Tax=Fulvimarina sp. MAC3 TaxID=3148887 RepID=UPI0031FD6790